jgi:hypothetical protein
MVLLRYLWMNYTFVVFHLCYSLTRSVLHCCLILSISLCIANSFFIPSDLFCKESLWLYIQYAHFTCYFSISFWRRAIFYPFDLTEQVQVILDSTEMIFSFSHECFVYNLLGRTSVQKLHDNNSTELITFLLFQCKRFQILEYLYG